MTNKLLALILISTLTLGACNSKKYCVGGKKKYKRMKKDTNMMVF